MDGTASVALVYNSQVLDQRNVSANAPQVAFTSPSAPEIWDAGSMHTLTWEASDQDGDSLTYALFYSKDGGISWDLLASELTSPEYVVDVDSMAGGSDVRFRVLVTDGINTGVDETDHAITIPNHAPEITINSPRANAIYPPGNLVVLQGSATDMEDGNLPDEALVWSSDLQGGLGVGPSIPLVTLEPGVHVITLTATDAYGVSNTASIQINIAHALYLPLLNGSQ